MQKMIRYLFLLTLIISGELVGRAEVIKLNQGWKFQRLDGRQVVGKIHNQGSDWSSQYNVEHTGKSGVLNISEDTLLQEFGRLQQGTWEEICLPHTPKIEDRVVVHQWQGVCYYKRKLTVLPGWKEKELWLEFGAAMHLADVWVNGRYVMQHAGGYLPFVVDLRDWLQWEGENEILVRLDNRDNGLIPPGKPLNALDFCYYGGLYRGVRLIVKDRLHITHPILADQVAGGGIFVRYPLVSDEQARVLIQCNVRNTGVQSENIRIRHSLYEIDGLFGKGRQGRKVEVGEASTRLAVGESVQPEVMFTLQEPRLWSPDAPHLYLLCSEVICGDRVVDREDTRVGIRRIEMTHDRGFLINGKPLRLVGSNRHMEYPYVGNALSDNAQYRDIYQIRTNGFNIVRLGHYPQDPSVLDACDELGLLAIEPIPGWQFFNRDSIFVQHTYRDVRHMIRRDRNHPSVVMWETTLNESWPPASWKNGAVDVAHEEYPGGQCFTSGDAYGYDGFEVCYNDWQEGFHRPNKTRKPGFIREYYDYEFGGHYSTSRITRGDGEKALRQNAWNAQWSHNRYRQLYPSTMGDAVWSMYDYNRGCCDNICYSGVADLFRLPKYSLAFFRSQVAPGTPQPGGPMMAELFIASSWEQKTGTADTLVVFGNVDEVELNLNGRLLARRGKDNGPDSDYVRTRDGGNCRELNFPPFTFSGISREPGMLKAVGYIGGRKVAEMTVRTPVEPVALEIGYFESGCPAATHDLLIVNVNLKDRNGSLVPLNDKPVVLTAEGGHVVGPRQYGTEAGVASFLVRTGSDRKLRLRATCGEMQTQRMIGLK